MEMITTRQGAELIADGLSRLTYAQMMDLASSFDSMGEDYDLTTPEGWASLLQAFAEGVDGMEFLDEIEKEDGDD